MIKVSVIVPVYNVEEKYFRKCINSVINQTLEEIEIILVDDGSTNNSSNICDEFAQKNKKIIVIHQKNQGVSSARNNGIKIAKGEYIMFVDSDDWLEDRACEMLYKYSEFNADFIIGRNYCYLEDKHKEIKPNFYGEDVNEIANKDEIYKMLLIDSNKNKYSYLATPWAKLYKKSTLENYKILFETNLKAGEDLIFNLDIITKGNKIFVVDEFIYHYRLHNRSTLYRLSDTFEKHMYNLYYCLDERSKRYNLKLADEICYYKIRYLNTILKYSNKIQKSAKEIKRIVNEPVYKDSIKEIDIKLLHKRRKLLVIFARIKFYYGIKLLYKIKK